MARNYPIWTVFTGTLAVLALSSCCDKAQAAKARADLYDQSAKLRNDAALVLAQCGADEGGKAVPRLIDLLYDPNIGVQSSAAYALRKIDTEEARAALDKATKRR